MSWGMEQISIKLRDPSRTSFPWRLIRSVIAATPIALSNVLHSSIYVVKLKIPWTQLEMTVKT